MKELNKKIKLTGQQKAAIEMVRNNQIALLVGKPGTGKTTVVKEISNWAESEKLHITQAAPTGKAAKRMIEATGRYAATIHSTLGCIFEDGAFQFDHNEQNPLSTDLLIVDEASMIPNGLMADLLRAVDSSRTKVLLIGDTGQLPSVGAGAVLRDLLASGKIPSVELDIIHRNSGKIVEACAAIHAGRSFSPGKRIDLEAENPVNLIHVECNTPERTLEAIRAIVCERMPLRGYDPVWDVQVISPVNSRGALSCDSINHLLQAELNPAETESHDRHNENQGKIKFLAGDKVINTKNEKVTATDFTPAYIVNGDMGRIVSITPDEKDMVVEFFEPDREVKLSKKNNNLLHAYAITCHRAQGSEAPVVIIPVHKSFGFFTTRKWIYTAISRAKEICITVGNFAAIDMMIRNTSGGERCTRLQEKLLQHFQGVAEGPVV